MSKISIIEPHTTRLHTKKHVAAYARVSKETERLNHSLSAQISRYSKLIRSNPDWEYAGVYSDSGITGTIAYKRPGFNRMLMDCEQHKIDIILVKSISRFSRNTVDLLKAVRHLKSLDVEVIFEKENIHSLSKDGEFMLTVLASFAQEEIRSLSDNIKWSLRKKFEQGIPIYRHKIYGYEWHGNKLVAVPEEAVIVRRIFNSFLEGASYAEISRSLNDENLLYLNGSCFCGQHIRHILLNITYTGCLLFQKWYVSDPITKIQRPNNGELTGYIVEDNHEPIINTAVFNEAVEKCRSITEAWHSSRSRKEV